MENILFVNALGLIVSKRANQEDGAKESGDYEIAVYHAQSGSCHLKQYFRAGDKIVCNKKDAQINVRPCPKNAEKTQAIADLGEEILNES